MELFNSGNAKSNKSHLKVLLQTNRDNIQLKLKMLADYLVLGVEHLMGYLPNGFLLNYNWVHGLFGL